MSMPSKLERVACGLSFPSSLTFADDGTTYVGESGVPFGEGAPQGRVWRLAAAGSWELVADGLGRPLNGLAWHAGSLYVSCGDDPGRIVRIDDDGSRTVLIDGLPGPGNYHVGTIAVGPDEKLYFPQGAMTNMAIIGLDAYELGWLKRLPHACDEPGLDVVLTGVNARTEDPFATNGSTTETGAFGPFGHRDEPGRRIAARVPCTASVMRCDLDGSNLELVAWGLRNAYGLLFLPDGRLIATDQGGDDRGSRPIGDVPDLLFYVQQGRWYGWPDFVGGTPVTDPRFRALRGPELSFVLANHDELPPPEPALMEFPTHVSAVKLDVAPSWAGDYAGHLFIALFGDERPMTAPEGPRAGRSIVRVDPTDWSLHPFATDGVDGLHRPIDLKFHPQERALYVLDFGRFEMTGEKTVSAEADTGGLVRISF
ncbi:MAG: sugar dehydrogenase [Myxococcales bacterium]|nr:MAG: sugar dehydrogenase [Myxococcales bacterium]